MKAIGPDERQLLGGLALPFAVMLGIHWLSSLQPAALPSALPVPASDKVAHCVMFAILLSSFRGWRGWNAPAWDWLPGAIAASIFVAVGDEWHQSFVPGRTPDVLDLVADVVGIALASVFWAGWSLFRPHRIL